MCWRNYFQLKKLYESVSVISPVQSVLFITFTHGRRLEHIADTPIHHELGSVELHHPALGLVI